MLRRLSLLAILLAGNGLLQAEDPVVALEGWTRLPRLNLEKLADGKVEAQCNASMGFARGLSAEAACVVDAPLEVTARVVLSSDPTKHPELNVYQYRSFRDESQAAFDSLKLDPRIGAVKNLLQSLSKPGSLQLSKDELAKAPKGASPEEAARFLSGVLRGRWSAAVSRGDLGQANGYDIRGEITSLLGEEPKLAKQFAPLLRPLTDGKAPISATEYSWDMSRVNGTATLELGFSVARAEESRRQVLEVNFFASSGYLASIAIYELVPVTVQGRTQTLVWQGCMVSSTELAGGFGIKRQIASVMMKNDMERSMRLLQQDAAKAAKD
jgi:hypothetical protein